MPEKFIASILRRRLVKTMLLRLLVLDTAFMSLLQLTNPVESTKEFTQVRRAFTSYFFAPRYDVSLGF
jgi:hypothetical protein